MAPAPKYTPAQMQALVLKAAIEAIDETSLLDFKMADIAKKAELSIGSVYKHVQSKEDVLVAIATKMAGHQLRVYSEVMNLPLTTPERLAGCVLLSPTKTHVYSFGVHLEMLTGNDAVLRRASPSWVSQLVSLDREIDAVFRKAMHHAAEKQELRVEEGGSVSQVIEELFVALWSISVGFRQVVRQRHAREAESVREPLPYPLPINHPLVRSVQRLLDSYWWSEPLTAARLEHVEALLTQKGYR